MALHTGPTGEVVDAVAWDGKTDDTSNCVGKFTCVEVPERGLCARVAVSIGRAVLIESGDYILENQDGTLDVCKASHFAAAYTAVP